MPQMRDAVMILLLVAVGILGYLIHSTNAVLLDQQRQTKDLSAKLESRAKTDALELQEKCAKQAALFFEDSGWKKKPQAEYANHYNQSLNRCFILIEDTDATNPNMIWEHKLLLDAFEVRDTGHIAGTATRKRSTGKCRRLRAK